MLSINEQSYFQPLSNSEAQTISGGVPATAAGILSKGIERISVDLRPFIDSKFIDKSGLKNKCTADLDTGILKVTCDLKEYVVGGGKDVAFAFSEPIPSVNIKAQ